MKNIEKGRRRYKLGGEFPRDYIRYMCFNGKVVRQVYGDMV